MKVTLAPHLGSSDILLGSFGEVLRDARFYEPRILREMITRDGVYQLAREVLRGKSWRDALNKMVKKRHKRFYGLRSATHPPAIDIRNAFPEEWSNFFKFCFVRNPYERVVSDYLYLTRKTSYPPSFSDYLRELNRTGLDFHGRSKYANWPMYTIDDNVALDFVGHYENLYDDFHTAMERVGLPNVQLTASEKRRVYSRPWWEYYESKDPERVRSLFGKEIELFDYEFGEGGQASPMVSR